MCESESVLFQWAACRWGEGGRKEREGKEEKKKGRREREKKLGGRIEADMGGAREGQSEKCDQNKSIYI